MRRIVLLWLCIVPTIAPTAARQRLITLDEALRLAEASPAAEALALEVDRARAELRASGLRSNPEIFLSREEAAGTVDRFANVSFPVPLTGRLSFEKAAARYGVDAAEARARQNRVELRGRVRETFLDLIATQEAHAALSEGRSHLEELVEILRNREKEGESSGFDRMRAERERADVEADLLNARVELDRIRETLAALLAIPSSDLVADGNLLSTAPLPAREEITALIASRGDIVALSVDAERADHLVRAAERRAVPEPVFTLGAKTTEVGGAADTGGVAAITFNVPIFDRGQGSRAVAMAEGALARAKHAALARQAAAGIESALLGATARRQAETAYAAGADAQELARIARAAYEAGEMRILDLLDAYRTALSVRLRTIELHVEARRAENGLNRALGTEVVR